MNRSASPRVARRGVRLRTTTVALLVGTVAVLCLLVGAVTHVSVRTQLDQQLDAQLLRAAERAGRVDDAQPGGRQGSLPDDLPSPPVDPDDEARDTPTAPEEPGGPGLAEFELGALLQGDEVIDAAWRDAEGRTHQLGAEDREALAAAAAGSGAGARVDVELSIGGYRLIAHPGAAGALEITGLPLAPVAGTVARLDLTLATAGLAATAVAGVAGWFLVGRSLRPLEQVARLASQVAGMPLARGMVALPERVSPAIAHNGTEAGDMGRALNLMLDNVEDALETRQRAEEGMRRFVADASHELRTPLTALRGYTEMLRMTEQLSERGETSLERMQVQAARMTSLVEDLLLLARLDEGTPVQARELDLGELVLDAATDAQAAAPGRRWALEVPEGGIPVHGDARQLSQVVVNLLSNATKHTPEGTSILVRLRREAGDGVLEVIDDGPGIDPAISAHVFDRFIRGDAVRSGSEGSTGLGLPIAAAILGAHGGSIVLDSEPGRTVFIVRLPLHTRSAPHGDA